MIASEPVGVVRSGRRRHHSARFAPLPRSKLPPRRQCMSSRIVPRFALTVVLVAALAAPAVAQDSPPQAPQPRAKAVGIDLSFGLPKVFEIELKWALEPVAPE